MHSWAAIPLLNSGCLAIRFRNSATMRPRFAQCAWRFCLIEAAAVAPRRLYNPLSSRPAGKTKSPRQAVPKAPLICDFLCPT